MLFFSYLIFKEWKKIFLIFSKKIEIIGRIRTIDLTWLLQGLYWRGSGRRNSPFSPRHGWKMEEEGPGGAKPFFEMTPPLLPGGWKGGEAF
jgi:hypothetical protein